MASRNKNVFLLLVCVVAIGLFQTCYAQQLTAKPNMVILLADDLGLGDVQYNNPLGSLAKTPNLNSMAGASGTIILNNTHSEAACTPSRVAILTARAPLRECVWGTPKKKQPLVKPGAPSVATAARDRGYRTLFLGKFPETVDENDPLGWPSALGFTNWTQINHGLTYDFPCFCRLGVPGNEKCFMGHLTPSDLEDHACWSRQSPNNALHTPPRGEMEAVHLAKLFDTWLGSISQAENFFVQISFRAVHKPFLASPELRAKCLTNEVCNDIGRDKTSLELDYAGCVVSIDQAVGMIRNSVRSRRPQDWANTIVVFVSDNGPEDPKKGGAGSALGLRGRKLSMYEGLLHVPALLEWPAVVKSNRVSNVLVSIMDFSATFLDALLHFRNETDVVKRDGMSLLPLLLNPSLSDAQFSRPRPLGICSCINDEALKQSKTVCDQLAFFDPRGEWKLLANRKNPSSRGANPSVAVPFALYDLFNVDYADMELDDQRKGNRDELSLMRGEANDWLIDLFADFQQNCGDYYPSK